MQADREIVNMVYTCERIGEIQEILREHLDAATTEVKAEIQVPMDENIAIDGGDLKQKINK